MQEKTQAPTEFGVFEEEGPSDGAVFRTALLSHLVAVLFLALWGWSLAQDAAALGLIPDELYRAEHQVTDAISAIDHAALELAHDGATQFRDGMCHVPPGTSSVEELEPEIVDGGFLIQAPPSLSCEGAEESLEQSAVATD